MATQLVWLTWFTAQDKQRSYNIQTHFGFWNWHEQQIHNLEVSHKSYFYLSNKEILLMGALSMLTRELTWMKN